MAEVKTLQGGSTFSLQTIVQNYFRSEKNSRSWSADHANKRAPGFKVK